MNLGVSIGLPVYNGEEFLRNKLENILEQTFHDFELIISDNASNDKTQLICQEFLKKDNRIKYFRQESNNGVTWNVNFVIKKATKEYFLLTAVDDLISNNFIEKNLEVIKKDKNVIGSIGKILPYKTKNNDGNFDESFKQVVNNLRDKTRPRKTLSLDGKYNDNVRNYLKKSTCQVIYGLFKTKEFRSIQFEPFIGNDWAVFLNVLKNGNFIVNNETTMYEYENGLTGKGLIESLKHYEHNSFGIIFPWLPLTSWCFKNLGYKLFFKNFDYFIQLQIEGLISISLDSIRKAIKKIKRNKKN